MSKARVIKEQSLNGEIHFILPSSDFDSREKLVEDFDEAEIRRIMKEEASKPLLLLRTE